MIPQGQRIDPRKGKIRQEGARDALPTEKTRVSGLIKTDAVQA
jgi:hypothetical protein